MQDFLELKDKYYKAQWVANKIKNFKDSPTTKHMVAISEEQE